MNLDFSEEQEVLRDTVRKLCAEASPLDVVRALEDDPKGVPEALWFSPSDRSGIERRVESFLAAPSGGVAPSAGVADQV